MEKIFSEDERIRRAEEIYFRRNNKNRNLMQNKEKKTYLGSKILLNLLLLFNISIIIFCFQNKDYIFSESFLTKFNEYNINISEKVNSVIKKYLIENEENNEINKNIIKNTANEENIIENNIIEENLESLSVLNQESSSMSEMEIDAKNLKDIYKFVKPLDLITISSVFGARESEYQNVTGYHTGIDLAAEKGTPIKAAMQGIVELVSSKGDYRETYKN